MKVTNNGVAGLNGGINKLEANKTEKSDKAGGVASSLENLGSSKKSAQVSGADKLALSERAQSMSRAKEIASDSSIDEAKVARLQKLIDEGKYKTDAGAIADRLVNEHFLMPE